MSIKSEHTSVMMAVIGFITVVLGVAAIGYYAFGDEEGDIQGQVEAGQYRVACKIPGRIEEICVKEGDYVHAGDTLAILEMPEVSAQEQAAKATEGAAQAISEMTDNGTRREQIRTAQQLVNQAVAARDIARKTYQRVQNLYDEGVASAQKRDEALAAYQASSAQVKAAQSQYEMARNGARTEEKKAASERAKAAKSSVNIVKSLLRESVQVATMDGEVDEVYAHVGELVSTGSTIMDITLLSDMWATFNIREDHLKGMKTGDVFIARSPAFNKDYTMKVYYIKELGEYTTWKAKKAYNQYSLHTFEVKARPISKHDGLRPGMTLILKKK
ncbi:MAG: efflux RND transporter periplasmic adaptor subunit [Prevotella sp.]|jgi:HlyD family secretion protein|nr:efflux RND transporter periplasmic adaptor subunit [Prevotella sp.]MCI2081543.1 efflux RND transporter periplasmic adaptor subunit [Prevotella sp.]MCI2103410.1 efflux RND transporter periplasmic adaptor subunit [Prevotella sp.]